VARPSLPVEHRSHAPTIDLVLTIPASAFDRC
jgi:hypothetical protein